MEDIFLKILNYSITAGWLVLAILAIRFIFRKMPQWVKCFLWALVGIRLAVPISVESVWSLIPSVETVPREIMYANTPQIQSGVAGIDQMVNPYLATSMAPEVTASANPMQIVTTLCSVLWISGLVVMFLYGGISFLRLKYQLRTATLFQKGIKQSERVDSPFVLGVFRPTIYVPYQMKEDDIEHVIAHEQAHICRKDHWWKPLGYLLLSIYWFHPLMWVAYLMLCRDIEVACDEKVIRELSQEERRAYATALLNCSVHRRSVVACPVAFGENGVKGRINKVMKYKKPGMWIIAASAILCVVVAIGFLTSPKRSSEKEMEENMTYPTVTILPTEQKKDVQTTEQENVADVKVSGEMKPWSEALEGFYGDYLFVPINGKSYRYEKLGDVNLSYQKKDILLEFTEQDRGSGRWRIYSLKEYPEHDVLVSESGILFCYKPALGASEEELQDAFSDAEENNFIVLHNGDSEKGDDIWLDFFEKSQKKQPGGVRIMAYVTLLDENIDEGYRLSVLDDYPMLFFKELLFDGDKFMIRPLNKIDGEYVVHERVGIDAPAQKFRYLMHYTEQPRLAFSVYSEIDRYVLTERDDVTWDELFGSLISSSIASDSTRFLQVYGIYK